MEELALAAGYQSVHDLLHEARVNEATRRNWRTGRTKPFEMAERIGAKVKRTPGEVVDAILESRRRYQAEREEGAANARADHGSPVGGAARGGCAD